MGKVQYKDESFYFIVIAVLGCILPPLTLYKVYSWYTAKKQKETKTAVTKRQKSRQRMQRISTIGWCIALPVLWWILYQVTDQVVLNPEEQIFDPFSILGLTEQASKRQIRSAYRKLAVQTHPDKGGSEAEFVRVQKAYNALTDDVARENYQKYGHPDGPQSMSVSIGLPSFLEDDDNHIYVMLVYTVLLVGMPLLGAVYCLCQSPNLSGATRKALGRALLADFEYGRYTEENIVNAERVLPRTQEKIVMFLSHTRELQRLLPSPLPPHSALEDIHAAITNEGISISPLSPLGSEDYNRSVTEIMVWCHLLRNVTSIQDAVNKNTQWAEAVVELQDPEGTFEACVKFILQEIAVEIRSVWFVYLLISLMQSHRTGLATVTSNPNTDANARVTRRKKTNKKKKNKKLNKESKSKADDAGTLEWLNIEATVVTKGEKFTAVSDYLTATVTVTIAADADPGVKSASWIVTVATPSRGKRNPAVLEGIESLPPQGDEGDDAITHVVQFPPFLAPDWEGWVKYEITVQCLDRVGVKKTMSRAVNIKAKPDDKED